jgi:hypothetical protein
MMVSFSCSENHLAFNILTLTVPDEGYSKHVSHEVAYLRVVNVSTRAWSLDTTKDIFIRVKKVGTPNEYILLITTNKM